MGPLLPQILWAQRKDGILLTIDLQDAKEPSIKLDNKGGTGVVDFTSKARSHATGPEFHDYQIMLELYAEINSEDSSISITDRRVLLVVSKKADDTDHWPRLLKSKDKVANIKVDWSKWVDDEEEDDKKEDYDLSDLQKYSNFDLGQAGAGSSGLDMSGAGLDEDSDDEDLPDLEPAGSGPST